MSPSTSCELARHKRPPRHPSNGRSDTLLANPARGFEVIHDDGSDQPQEHSVKLNGRIHRTRWRTIDSVKYMPASIFPVLYTVHRLYRNFRPRRLPTFTSLTLLELYMAAATPVLAKCLAVPDLVDSMLDDDGHIILLAGKRLRYAMDRDSSLLESFRRWDVTMAQTPAGREQLARLKWLREGNDRSGNIIQRVVWWYRHPAWHDRSTWNGVAMLLLEKYKKPDDTQPPVETVRRDWDLCVTFITTMPLLDRMKEWQEKSWKLFAASIPAAWLARLSGRRWLYMPMGGAQRLFLGTFLYSYWALNAGLFQHIKRIHDKGTFARLVTAVFGDLTNDMTGFPKDDDVQLFLELFE